MRNVPDDYFAKGPFRKEGAFAFRTYTCVQCGFRTRAWDTFRSHRTVCQGIPAVPQMPDAVMKWAKEATQGQLRKKMELMEPEDLEALENLLRDMDGAA